jgi:hypothetical protein
MRHWLASSVVGIGVLLVVALAWPLSACIHASCNGICEPSFGATLHVPGSAASLFGASVAFCRNGACGSAIVGAASDAGVVNRMVLEGAPFGADVDVEDEGDGFTVIGISLHVSGLTFTDGDTYSVTITDSHGATLLGVTRPVTYNAVQSCGAICLDYDLDVYPTSPSGVTCGDKSCVSGIEFTGTLTTTDTSDPVTVSLCRNGACGTGSATLSPVADAIGEQQQGNLQGALSAGFVFVSKTPQTFAFQISRGDDSAALHDGDVYALTITQGSTTLAQSSSPVTYDTTSPNGAQCDVFPCRHATVSVP